MTDKEYRVSIEGNNGTYLVMIYKVNIEPRGVHVADFESRSIDQAIQKAATWIKKDAKDI